VTEKMIIYFNNLNILYFFIIPSFNSKFNGYLPLDRLTEPLNLYVCFLLYVCWTRSIRDKIAPLLRFVFG
jgi:hypothetical protein